jgi:hypothetical protein
MCSMSNLALVSDADSRHVPEAGGNSACLPTGRLGLLHPGQVQPGPTDIKRRRELLAIAPHDFGALSLGREHDHVRELLQPVSELSGERGLEVHHVQLANRDIRPSGQQFTELHLHALARSAPVGVEVQHGVFARDTPALQRAHRLAARGDRLHVGPGRIDRQGHGRDEGAPRDAAGGECTSHVHRTIREHDNLAAECSAPARYPHVRERELPGGSDEQDGTAQRG